MQGQQLDHKRCVQRNVHKYHDKHRKITKKNRYNQVESVIICSFAFNNQNVAETKENFVGTCVPASPTCRNYGPQTFLAVYT